MLQTTEVQGEAAWHYQHATQREEKKSDRNYKCKMKQRNATHQTREDTMETQEEHSAGFRCFPHGKFKKYYENNFNF